MNITILDRHAPLVLLWGPCCIGKTMALKRLFDFLIAKGYGIRRDDTYWSEDFHNEVAKYYKNLLEEVPFPTYLPMMSKVFGCNGRTICQFIDLPGNDCFNPTNNNGIYPQYINQLLLVPNRKVFVIFVELDWWDSKVRLSYAKSILRLYNCMSSRDRIIFIVPKMDKQPFLVNDKKQLFALTNNQYPTLFEHFATRNPIVRIFKPYKFEFIPFSSGYISFDSNGNADYSQGNEIFPQTLSRAIFKALKI